MDAGCGCAGLQVALSRLLLARTLLAEEATIVASAVTRRRNEFAAGRYCARKALSLLGYDELAAGHLIAGHDELCNIAAMLSGRGSSSAPNLEPPLFALIAKEAAIKNLSPGMQHFIDFRDCRIRCQPENIEITVAYLQRRLVICWRVFGNLLVTLSRSDGRDTVIALAKQKKSRPSCISLREGGYKCQESADFNLPGNNLNFIAKKRDGEQKIYYFVLYYTRELSR